MTLKELKEVAASTYSTNSEAEFIKFNLTFNPQRVKAMIELLEKADRVMDYNCSCL